MIQPVSVSGLLTTVTLPTGLVQTLQQQQQQSITPVATATMLQSSAMQLNPIVQHPVIAGGSITTGIAGPPVMQQQSISSALIGVAAASMTPGSQVIGNSDPILSPISTPQLQHQQAQLVNSNIVQTPTRPDIQGKSKLIELLKLFSIFNS